MIRGKKQIKHVIVDEVDALQVSRRSEFIFFNFFVVKMVNFHLLSKKYYLLHLSMCCNRN